MATERPDAVLAHGCAGTPFDLGRRVWRVTSAAPPDQRDAVDVWRVRHDAVGATSDVLGLLDRAERARADRYRRAEHRRRFVVGRGGLRTVLAVHGGTDPALIDIAQRCKDCGGAHGPVVVRGPPRVAGVHVSTAHAGRWTTVAVARGRTVGVDVERDDADVTGVADVAASAAERHALQGLPVGERRAAALELWTRKEAYVKGLGTGLVTALDAVDVLGTGVASNVAGASSWHLHHLAVDRVHRGALAVDGDLCVTRLWTLDPGWAPT